MKKNYLKQVHEALEQIVKWGGFLTVVIELLKIAADKMKPLVTEPVPEPKNTGIVSPPDYPFSGQI